MNERLQQLQRTERLVKKKAELGEYMDSQGLPVMPPTDGQVRSLEVAMPSVITATRDSRGEADFLAGKHLPDTYNFWDSESGFQYRKGNILHKNIRNGLIFSLEASVKKRGRSNS